MSEKLSSGTINSTQKKPQTFGFVGILIYMSAVNLQILERYLSTPTLYRNSIVPSVMSIKNLFFIQINTDGDKG